jgi:hypothetical protein
MWSKWQPLPFFARGWILQNSLLFSNKISTWEPKNDYWKKIMSKLWCTCTSNFPNFLPNQHNLVFFVKGGWKAWDTQLVGDLYTKWGMIFLKIGVGGAILICILCTSLKKPFWHSENRKWTFYAQKWKPPKRNIVWHPKRLTCAQYGAILNKLCYVFGHELGHLAWKPWNSVHGSLFWEGFSRIFGIIQVCHFSLKLGHITSGRAREPLIRVHGGAPTIKKQLSGVSHMVKNC